MIHNNYYRVLNFDLQYKHMENAWAATCMIISRISRFGHVKKRYCTSWSHDCHINNIEPESSKCCLLT